MALELEEVKGVHWFWYMFWLVFCFPVVIIVWLCSIGKKDEIRKRNKAVLDAVNSMAIVTETTVVAPAAQISEAEAIHRRNLETITALKG